MRGFDILNYTRMYIYKERDIQRGKKRSRLKDVKSILKASFFSKKSFDGG